MRFCTISFPRRSNPVSCRSSKQFLRNSNRCSKESPKTSKVTAKELDTLARINPPLTLEVSHLPRIEQAARESIDKETTKQMLRSTGVDLEFNMVSSQLAAMNYAAHLARSLAVVETNPRRKEFLQRTDRKFSDLHGQVYKMLFTRYQR